MYIRERGRRVKCIYGRGVDEVDIYIYGREVDEVDL